MLWTPWIPVPDLELLAWVLVDGDLHLERGIEMAKQAQKRPTSFFDPEKSLPHRASAEHSLRHGSEATLWFGKGDRGATM
jgi:hypothetical protein